MGNRQTQGGKHNMGVDADIVQGQEPLDLRFQQLRVAHSNCVNVPFGNMQQGALISCLIQQQKGMI
jgi:hypothetical protein